MSDSSRPHRLQPTRLLCPWDFPGKSTVVGCHLLLQGIFLNQGLNPGLQHCRQALYHLSHQGSQLLSKAFFLFYFSYYYLLLLFYYIYYYLCYQVISFLGGSDSKESTCSLEDLGSILGLGRFPWRTACSVFLPGESPWAEEPDGLSMGLQSVGYDWLTKYSTAQWPSLVLKILLSVYCVYQQISSLMFRICLACIFPILYFLPFMSL